MERHPSHVPLIVTVLHLSTEVILGYHHRDNETTYMAAT